MTDTRFIVVTPGQLLSIFSSQDFNRILGTCHAGMHLFKPNQECHFDVILSDQMVAKFPAPFEKHRPSQIGMVLIGKPGGKNSLTVLSALLYDNKLVSLGEARDIAQRFKPQLLVSASN